MPWRSVAVAVALGFGAAHMATPMAFARGMSGGAHFAGGGFAGHRFAISRGFPGHRLVIRRGFLVRAFHRNFFPGGLWPYYSFPSDAYGGTDTATYPETAGLAAEPIPVPICHRSEEIVRVPAVGGGTSQIKIINCPNGL